MSEALNYFSIKNLIEQNELDFEECFNIFFWLNKTIGDNENESDGRDILLRLLDKKSSLPESVLPILNDYIDRFGYYPYLDEGDALSTRSLIKYEFHRSENISNIVMHQKQAEISEAISNQKSIILSAPTSFGKSLLIEEIVAKREYRNIVIILPTLALIDETRKKLLSYTDEYKLIFTSKQPLGHKNIFILTPERLLESESLPEIDYFIIDEFYKLDGERNDDERLNVLNHAFYKLIKKTANFYLLGPNIASIPDGFQEEYNCEFIPSNFATVACDETIIKRKSGRGAAFRQLVDLLDAYPEQSMIYCKGPGSAESRVKDFLRQYPERLISSNKHNDVITWIKKNIHPNWLLVEALKYGIAFHHGAMPRHLGIYIVDAFNEGKIRYLFCTSTLIEGINTTAKNIIIYDNKKGTSNISYFDYKNIRGRAGRMKKHYLGRVFTFHSPPDDSKVDVDFPWYTQVKASDEILIQVEENDLKPFAKAKINPYKEQTFLDVEIIKKNNNIPVKGQLALAEAIQRDIAHYNKELAWTNYPTWEQLKFACNLIYDYLKFNSRDVIFSGNQLAFYVFNYVRLNSNLAAFIKFLLQNDNHISTPDQAVQKVIKISRTWFEFKFPKLLLGLNQIQESIFKAKDLPVGDYRFYSSFVESASCSPTLSHLQEFGLPMSILKQLEPHLKLKGHGEDKEDDLEEIIKQIKRVNVDKLGLDPFEKKILASFNKQ